MPTMRPTGQARGGANGKVDGRRIAEGRASRQLSLLPDARVPAGLLQRRRARALPDFSSPRTRLPEGARLTRRVDVLLLPPQRRRRNPRNQSGSRAHPCRHQSRYQSGGVRVRSAQSSRLVLPRKHQRSDQTAGECFAAHFTIHLGGPSLAFTRPKLTGATWLPNNSLQPWTPAPVRTPGHLPSRRTRDDVAGGARGCWVFD